MARTAIPFCALMPAIAFAAGLLSLQPAAAGTTTLICRLTQPTQVTEQQPTTIDLDDVQNTVMIHYGPTYTDEGGPHSMPASDLGPLPATFTANAITFSDHRGGTYTINRLTGIFSNSYYFQWACEPGKAKF